MRLHHPRAEPARYLQRVLVLADGLAGDDVLGALQQGSPGDGGVGQGLLAVVAPGPVRVRGLHHDGHLVAGHLDGLVHAGQPGARPEGSGCGGPGPPVAVLLKEDLLALVSHGLRVPRGAWKLDAVAIVVPVVGEVRGPLVNGRHVQDVGLVGVWSADQRGELIWPKKGWRPSSKATKSCITPLQAANISHYTFYDLALIVKVISLSASFTHGHRKHVGAKFSYS